LAGSNILGITTFSEQQLKELQAPKKKVFDPEITDLNDTIGHDSSVSDVSRV
jgi:hypothetical protein